MTSLLKWSRIPAQALPRSSHSLSIVGGKAFIFGGEVNPREPVDNAIHSIDLTTGQYSSISGRGDVPEARVGHTASVVAGEILVFGGRGGPAMTPLTESGAVHAFNPSTSTWHLLASSSPKYPCARSYHASTASPTHLIIHAGCGDAATGRLRDVWAFEPKSRTWMQLEDAPGDPRGGTTTAWSDGQIWRFGGFNGKTEIGGMIDVLPFSDISPNLNRSWSTVPYSKSSNLESLGPGARSVAAIHSFGQDTLMTLFGEGKPSPTGGHDSAGNFWGDVWSFSPSSSSWTERKVEVKDQDVQNGGPGERGWFASDMDLEGGKVVIWGGIDQGNKRLGDGWILSA